MNLDQAKCNLLPTPRWPCRKQPPGPLCLGRPLWSVDSSLPFLKASFFPALPDLQETDPWSFLQPGGPYLHPAEAAGIAKNGQAVRSKARFKAIGSPTVRMGMPCQGRQPGSSIHSEGACRLPKPRADRHSIPFPFSMDRSIWSN